MKISKNTAQLATCLISVFVLAAWTECATTGVKTDKKDPGLSQLVNPAGLEDPLYRWNAELVGMPTKDTGDIFEETYNDYATCYLKDPWDFDEGDDEGISVFSKGMKDTAVKNGKLTFTTGEKAYFYWNV